MPPNPAAATTLSLYTSNELILLIFKLLDGIQVAPSLVEMKTPPQEVPAKIVFPHKASEFISKLVSPESTQFQLKPSFEETKIPLT